MKEFCIIWFEETQKYMVLFSNGTLLRNNFCSIGVATNEAMNFSRHGKIVKVEELSKKFYRYIEENNK